MMLSSPLLLDKYIESRYTYFDGKTQTLTLTSMVSVSVSGSVSVDALNGWGLEEKCKSSKCRSRKWDAHFIAWDSIYDQPGDILVGRLQGISLTSTRADQLQGNVEMMSMRCQVMLSVK